MSLQSPFSVGSPVDSWWNGLRSHINRSIELLAHSPSFDAPADAARFLQIVESHYSFVQRAPYPQEAEVAREYLLVSFRYLCDSFRSQSQSAHADSDQAYEFAYHKFMMFTQTLLSRGIYEPDPTTLH